MGTSSETTVAVATSSGPFVGASPARCALIVSNPLTNRVTLSTRSPAVDGNGIRLQAGVGVTVLTRDDVGDWVERAIFAIATGGAETIGIVEVLDQWQEPS